MNHITRTDEEIFKLSSVNLVYLGPTVYGIIHEICAPQPGSVVCKPISSNNSSKRTGKTTCRDSSHSRGRKSTKRAKHKTEQQRSIQNDRPKTLSEKRQANFGISATNITTRTVQSSRQPIDYVSLNDGYDEEEGPETRKKPSASRISAHRIIGPPNTAPAEGDITADMPVAIPSTSAPSLDPTQADITLPDLVVNRSEVPKADLLAATNTPEDLEAANTLLSLVDSLEDTQEEDDKTALLMPIGGANNPEDIAPQPIRLDRDSVDNTIAELVEMEELKKSSEKETDQPQQISHNCLRTPPSIVQPSDISANTKKGSLTTKTYVLKKPVVKRSFKCSECNTVKPTVQKLNEHHRKWHNPQMCGICKGDLNLHLQKT